MCRICSEGTFSDISSDHQSCMQHKNCSDTGLQWVLKGSTWHDSVCGNCEELKGKSLHFKQHVCKHEKNPRFKFPNLNEGNRNLNINIGISYLTIYACSPSQFLVLLKIVLTTFLSDGAEYLKEIIPAFFIHHKMNIKRLRRIVHRLPTEDGKKPGEPLELNLSELHKHIAHWTSSATATQIQQLPNIVNKAGATSVGEKLQSKLNRIQTHLTEHCPSELLANYILP